MTRARKPTKLRVYSFDVPAGILSRTDEGYEFRYLDDYLGRPNSTPIAHLLPLRREPFRSKTLFPFFQGLCFEGELLAARSQAARIDPEDYFLLLANFGDDTIGSTRYEAME